MPASKNPKLIVFVFVHLLMMTNNHTISAQAVSTYSVRLVNTLSSVSNPMEGRLEIYYNGIWGTVCDDGFTNASARVACASLGYGYIGTSIENRHGGGTGKIWLDDLTCAGSEYGIEKCPHRAWDSHDCSHGEDVSISCGTSSNFAIRLINSLSSVNNPNEGRLEIFYNGTWGTVCDDSFTNTSATVACNSLGYGYIGTVIPNRHSVGTDIIWLDDVTCGGAEPSIDRCWHGAWGSHDCSHLEDVAISCGATPRLVNSLSSVTNPNEGRFEIYYAGEWGTVCDDNFANISARVACQSLGFGYIGTVITNRHGSGTGLIWLDEITCGGTEPSIDRCLHRGWGLHDCTHTEDIAISCGATPRLVNSLSSVTNPQEGRLDIYYAGEWGTVCDDSFTNISAGVACKSLGFRNIGTLVANRHENGTGPIWLDDVRCTGTELGIDRCAHNAWGTNDCSHDEDVLIRCGDTPDYAVRLVNTLTDVSTVMEGRLEIYYSGTWGTVCDDSFTNASARVACASLGFGYVGRFIGNRHTNGTGQIWLDEVNCLGIESGLELCQHSSWGIHNCGHSEDVSIVCGNTSDFSVRLINSVAGDVNPMEGQLEIYYSGVWGAVCNDEFTDAAARVACASLGFGYTGQFIGNRYGFGRGQIWLDDVICNGTELSIDQCSHRAWGSHNCHRGKLVSIKCGDTEDFDVRLINSQDLGRNPMEGRLEIYFAGVWGSVCDDRFTNITAQVVCASLGYGYVGTYMGRSHYGAGTGKIWMDDVVCTGREPSIDKCTHRPWGLHNCNHSEDVGVKCGIARNFALRLVNSLSHITNPKDGRLEIYYSGSWGTVCNDNFTDFSARVACASLGFGRIGTFIGNRHGPGTGQIALDEVVCACTEQNIDVCAHSPWGRHDCNHGEDVSISCGATTRLVNSLYAANNPREGRLEIYYGGRWGTVCSSGLFTEANAKVVCASLGFGYNGTFIGNRHGNGTGQIWLDRVSCGGTEQSIDMCPRSPWGSHNCSHNEDVSIRCGDTQDFAVRLINSLGNNSKEGRLEIYYSGIWGTVCDDHFANASAGVACASLGFGYVGAAIGNRHGGGTNAIWLDDVKCNGTESSIDSCAHKEWGVHDCGHGEDVSISCGTIARLANSSGNPMEGRLEINYAGVWGTVCDDSFNDISARVACASLGFGHVGAFVGSRYGSGTGQIWLDDVVCNGTETRLDQCAARPWGIHNCGHSEDVSISCVTNQTSTRLATTSTGANSKSTTASTLSSIVSTVTKSTPTTLPSMSTMSNNSKVSDSKTSEFTMSSEISTSTSTASPSTMTTSMPTRSRSTSLLLTRRSTSTISPSKSKLFTTSTKTSAAMTNAATSSSPTTPKASFMSESMPVTLGSSEIKSKSITAFTNDATSEKPSSTVTLSTSDLLRNSSNSSTDAASPGYGAIRILGIVGAILIGIIFLIIVVLVRRRYKRSPFWSTGQDSSSNSDLIALKDASSEHNNEENSGLIYDDCVSDVSPKHYNFYTDS